MKKGLFVALATLLLLLATASGAKETRTLNGQYFFGAGDPGDDLEAIFTPAGDGQWTVAFNFEFRNRPHTYRGTAEGSLGAGKLEGRVKNESGARTFVFWGSFSDGKFRGEHAEIEGRRKVPKGTLTLAE